MWRGVVFAWCCVVLVCFCALERDGVVVPSGDVSWDASQTYFDGEQNMFKCSCSMDVPLMAVLVS